MTTHEVKQLRLAPGDILVVKTYDAANKLRAARDMLDMTFSVPIIIAPLGIDLVDKAVLAKLIGYRQLTMTELKSAISISTFPEFEGEGDNKLNELSLLSNLNFILSRPKEEYMAPKKLTIIEAYKRLDTILSDFRNGEVTSEPTSDLLWKLNRDAKAAELPFNINITEDDLNATQIGTATEPSGSSSGSW